MQQIIVRNMQTKKKYGKIKIKNKNALHFKGKN